VEIAEVAPDDARLPRVFEVMAELRTHLDVDRFRELYEQAYPEGYRVAGVFDGDDCRAAAGYRLTTNLISGRHLYIDDLVTGDAWRSHGYGRLLNKYLLEKARNEGCGSIQLDSGVHRGDAHRFYFRERYRITSFHLSRYLGDAAPPAQPEPPKDPQ
jgi:GNAT superfamily N-acetyltransferase